METQPPTEGIAPAEVSKSWPALSVTERRVLGVLVEKAKTTPEVYPLSLNSLVTGSNQKSNREPVLNLTEEDVDTVLTSLQQKGLVTRITGGRVDRWRHNLYEQWQVEKVELAVLAELLLRGPQTEGELRGRAGRMEPIADLDALRSHLRPLRERGLVVFLGEEGKRGTQITHGFHDPAELERIRQHVPAGPIEPAGFHVPPVDSALKSDVEQVKVELAALRSLVAELQSRLTKLVEEVGGSDQ